MTSSPTVHAKVKRKYRAYKHRLPWLTVAWIHDTDLLTGKPINIRHRFADAPTWHDAMQAAQQLRADLERELMDEVHASRASRRTERAAQLEAEQQPVPMSVCAWCHQLGHIVATCPTWLSIKAAR